MCACATTEKALCSPSFSQRSVATRVCPRRVAIAGHVIKLKLTRRGNTLASMESGLFQFTDDVVTMAVSQCVTELLR